MCRAGINLWFFFYIYIFLSFPVFGIKVLNQSGVWRLLILSWARSKTNIYGLVYYGFTVFSCICDGKHIYVSSQQPLRIDGWMRLI